MEPDDDPVGPVEEESCCKEHPDGWYSFWGCFPVTWWFWGTWWGYGKGVDAEQEEAVLVSDQMMILVHCFRCNNIFFLHCSDGNLVAGSEFVATRSSSIRAFHIDYRERTFSMLVPVRVRVAAYGEQTDTVFVLDKTQLSFEET